MLIVTLPLTVMMIDRSPAMVFALKEPRPAITDLHSAHVHPLEAMMKVVWFLRTFRTLRA